MQKVEMKRNYRKDQFRLNLPHGLKCVFRQDELYHRMGKWQGKLMST
jgi:hypothetical protein